jgi:hypothetical protein
MYFSISNEAHIVDGEIQYFFRISFIDGRTILFSDIDECFAYANDKRYNYRIK